MLWSFFKNKKNQEAPPNEKQAEVVQLPVAQITPNRYQPRRTFNEASLQELALTIDAHGLLQPIIVRQSEADRYEIIAGERRFRAANLLGWEKIPAIIKEMTNQEVASMALIENLQREGLTAIEEATAYQQLLHLNKMSQVELAKGLGKSQSFIANKMRLLRLTEVVQEMLLERVITERHGRALVGLPDTVQIKFATQIVYEQLSVKETEQLVKSYKSSLASADAKAKRSAKEIKKALKTIKKSLASINSEGLDLKTVEEDHEGYHRIIIDIPIEEANKPTDE